MASHDSGKSTGASVELRLRQICELIVQFWPEFEQWSSGDLGRWPVREFGLSLETAEELVEHLRNSVLEKLGKGSQSRDFGAGSLVDQLENRIETLESRLLNIAGIVLLPPEAELGPVSLAIASLECGLDAQQCGHMIACAHTLSYTMLTERKMSRSEIHEEFRRCVNVSEDSIRLIVAAFFEKYKAR